MVPSRYEANLKLGKWVETQRYEYTKLKRAETDPNEKPEELIQEDTKLVGKPRVTNARLTEERLRRLESIGFEWKVRNKMKRYYDKQWQDMFDQLLDFKTKNGHTMVPKRFPDNPRLANWVHTQRVRAVELVILPVLLDMHINTNFRVSSDSISKAHGWSTKRRP